MRNYGVDEGVEVIADFAVWEGIVAWWMYAFVRVCVCVSGGVGVILVCVDERLRNMRVDCFVGCFGGTNF